ncbi:MAG: dUTP diphosphatase, partial [Gaiellales bacterium]
MSDVLFKRLHPEARLPQQAHHDDAGHDLHATEERELAPGARAAVGCGFAMALPPDMAALVMPRSGLALKEGIGVLNAPGLIDAGYRGEIKVILINHDATETRTIGVGDRIAQLVLVRLPQAGFRVVDELPTSA